jgi:hypothetical protein
MYQLHGDTLLTSIGTETARWDLSDPGDPQLHHGQTTLYWGGAVGWGRGGHHYMVGQLAGHVGASYRSSGSTAGTEVWDPSRWQYARLWGTVPWRRGWLVAAGSVAYTVRDCTAFNDAFESGDLSAWSETVGYLPPGDDPWSIADPPGGAP